MADKLNTLNPASRITLKMLVVIEIVNRVAKNIIILVIGIVLGENRNISSLIYRYITISTGINAISTETISLIPVSDTIFISNRLANISNNIVFRPRAMNTVAFGVNFLIDIIPPEKKQSSLY